MPAGVGDTTTALQVADRILAQSTGSFELVVAGHVLAATGRTERARVIADTLESRGAAAFGALHSDPRFTVLLQRTNTRTLR